MMTAQNSSNSTNQAAAAKAIAANEQSKVTDGGKVGGKDVIIHAAILPIVSSKTKEVFLKVIPKDAEEQIEAVKTTIEAGKVAGLGNELKQFIKGHDKVAVWTSKAANVNVDINVDINAAKIVKAQERQVAFWNNSGFTITNMEQMTKDMEALADKAVKAAKRKSKATA